MGDGIKTAAIVVWYNPTSEVVENIKSYGKCIDKIYCIDNSTTNNKKYCKDNRIEYIPLYINTGIAFAFNIGCKKAIEEGVSILITFDQDTFCTCDVIERLIMRVRKEKKNTLIAPNIKYIYRNNGKRVFSDEIAYEKKEENPCWVISSGCAFTRETYQDITGFDNKLFIGQVDQDFCFRLKRKGGSIIRLGDVFIYQELGNTVSKKILGHVVHIPNLTAMRYYYIFRNEEYLRQKWGDEYQKYSVNTKKYIISILFFETKKMSKIGSCIKGVYDGKRLYN